MLSFKGMHFCSMFGSNHKKVFRKLIKKPLPESILNNLSFPKNCFHHRRFPAYFLKVFRKRRTAALYQNLTRTKPFLVLKEKQLIRKLFSFLGIKCFPFFKFICKWLLQHNISYAICISCLSALDQSRI